MPPGRRRGWGGGGGGRGHGHGRGPRPRRIRRLLEPALLHLLRAGPLHGYALVGGLEELGLEAYPADLSGIYRVLRDLEEMGAVVSAWDEATSGGPPRRVYELTPMGREYLSEWVHDLRATADMLSRFLAAYDQGGPETESS